MEPLTHDLIFADASTVCKAAKSGQCEWKCRGALASDPNKVSPSQQIKEFQAETPTIFYGHLFCSACCEQCSLKRIIVKNHVESQNYQKYKENLRERMKDNKTLLAIWGNIILLFGWDVSEATCCILLALSLASYLFSSFFHSLKHDGSSLFRG